MAVLDPVKLVILNWAELMGSAEHLDPCSAPVHPHHPEMGQRHFKFGRELWIERTDYEETPPKGYHRLYPGNKVRLKYGHVIECVGATRDAEGRIVEVQARLLPDTKSGTPGADAVKVKGVMTWVGVNDAVPCEIRLYERLFSEANPGAGDLLAELNASSLTQMTGFVEPALSDAPGGAAVQFERHGYFVVDDKAHAGGQRVFNRATGLKDSWGK
jgi:glutaminyl-tRNA synthetase